MIKDGERDLIFCREADGIVRAEYRDKNGNSQSCPFFKDSTTALRKETISMGKDGNPVKKEIPYQTMKTTSFDKDDNDIQDIRINIYINNGSMEIYESRQGQNGDWTDVAIELRGRDYNSKELNDATSTRTGNADPNRDTEAFNNVAGTSLAVDGIQYGETQNPGEPLIEQFIKEGYNREEATKIYGYMTGEEKLKEDAAKAKVNEEIRQNNRKKDTDYGENDGDGETPDGRTRGGDAWKRRMNRK